MSRLGITRDAALLGDLGSKAESVGVEIVPLPLIETVSVEFELPKVSIDWIFLTSANGVKFFFEQLTEFDFSEVRFAVVGDKTDKALNSFGLEASFIPTEAYGKNLFEEFVDNNKGSKLTVLFARAESVNYEPIKILDEAGYDYYPLVCYKTVPNEIDKNSVSSFGSEDAILFTAPSTVRSYQDQFGNPKAKPIAIGKSTALEMTGLNWNNHILMDNPDIEKVLEYI